MRRIIVFVLGHCPDPLCGQGEVTVAKRSDGRLFAICDECEGEWADVELAPTRKSMGAAVVHDVWPPLFPTKDDIANAGLIDRVEEKVVEVE